MGQKGRGRPGQAGSCGAIVRTLAFVMSVLRSMGMFWKMDNGLLWGTRTEAEIWGGGYCSCPGREDGAQAQRVSGAAGRGWHVPSTS